jgi:hypothetical protein
MRHPRSFLCLFLLLLFVSCQTPSVGEMPFISLAHGPALKQNLGIGSYSTSYHLAVLNDSTAIDQLLQTQADPQFKDALEPASLNPRFTPLRTLDYTQSISVLVWLRSWSGFLGEARVTINTVIRDQQRIRISISAYEPTCPGHWDWLVGGKVCPAGIALVHPYEMISIPRVALTGAVWDFELIDEQDTLLATTTQRIP